MRRRARRFDAADGGSLSLQNVRLLFKLDDAKRPTGFFTFEPQDSNRTLY